MGAKRDTHLLHRRTAERKGSGAAEHFGMAGGLANQKRCNALSNQRKGGRK
jgi:hypothetical protein